MSSLPVGVARRLGASRPGTRTRASGSQVGCCGSRATARFYRKEQCMSITSCDVIFWAEREAGGDVIRCHGSRRLLSCLMLFAKLPAAFSKLPHTLRRCEYPTRNRFVNAVLQLVCCRLHAVSFWSQIHWLCYEMKGC